MLQFLNSPIGDSKIMQAGVLFAIFIAIALTLIILWRIVFQSRVRGNAIGGKPSRIAVVDVFDLDRNRQLVLVRRDQVEHLVMIGGPNDLVVETGIVRTALPMRDKERNIDKDPAQIMPVHIDARIQKAIDTKSADHSAINVVEVTTSEIKAVDIKPRYIIPPLSSGRDEVKINSESSAPAVEFPATLQIPVPAEVTTPGTAALSQKPNFSLPQQAERDRFTDETPSSAATTSDEVISQPDISKPAFHKFYRPISPTISPAALAEENTHPSEHIADKTENPAEEPQKPFARTPFISRPVPQPRTLTPISPRPQTMSAPTSFSPIPAVTAHPTGLKRPQIALQPVAPPSPKSELEVQTLEGLFPIDELELEMARLLGRPVKLD